MATIKLSLGTASNAGLEVLDKVHCACYHVTIYPVLKSLTWSCDLLLPNQVTPFKSIIFILYKIIICNRNLYVKITKTTRDFALKEDESYKNFVG